jgi:hypothetical protein
MPSPRHSFRSSLSGPSSRTVRCARVFSTQIVTRDATPLLSSEGSPTGRSIAGAVTVELTSTQFEFASRHDLWVQGGMPDDPVLNQLYPGAYGFGALRCAIDNYNGDNVEYIAYPLGARHVFCFAYYVASPTSGTIVVRKEVDAPGDVAAHDFRFGGNLSYNPGGAFTLNAAPGRPASATFYRAGYDIQESTPIGDGSWQLESVTCNGVPVGSAQGRIRIRLTVDQREMDCTFTDRYSRAQPSEPGGGGSDPARSDPSPTPNLAVTKRVRRRASSAASRSATRSSSATEAGSQRAASSSPSSGHPATGGCASRRRAMPAAAAPGLCGAPSAISVPASGSHSTPPTPRRSRDGSSTACRPHVHG